MQLTNKEQTTNLITLAHIDMVRALIFKIVKLLLDRSLTHDISKLSPPEVNIFSQYIDQLGQHKYGSDEYFNCQKLMSDALEHHYANNRHHPQHFPNGINDMNLVDVIEMFCDWKAASSRDPQMDIAQSLEINQRRFDISPQLLQIFVNSLNLLD